MANGLENGTFLPNLHGVLRVLEGGMVLTRFYSRKKPEKRNFLVRLETRQLIWNKANWNSSKPEGMSMLISFELIV